jgi:hypothetical protein
MSFTCTFSNLPEAVDFKCGTNLLKSTFPQNVYTVNPFDGSSLTFPQAGVDPTFWEEITGTCKICVEPLEYPCSWDIWGQGNPYPIISAALDETFYPDVLSINVTNAGDAEQPGNSPKWSDAITPITGPDFWQKEVESQRWQGNVLTCDGVAYNQYEQEDTGPDLTYVKIIQQHRLYAYYRHNVGLEIIGELDIWYDKNVASVITRHKWMKAEIRYSLEPMPADISPGTSHTLALDTGYIYVRRYAENSPTQFELVPATYGTAPANATLNILTF